MKPVCVYSVKLYISLPRWSEAEDSHSQSSAQGEYNTLFLQFHGHTCHLHITLLSVNQTVMTGGGCSHVHQYLITPASAFLFLCETYFCSLSTQNPKILLLDEATR